MVGLTRPLKVKKTKNNFLSLPLTPYFQTSQCAYYYPLLSGARLEPCTRSLTQCNSFMVEKNGMLRHSFEPLEGSNILWHIVAPPLPSQPDFLSLSLSYRKECGIITPLCYKFFEWRLCLRNFPLWKIVGPHWEEAEIRLRVNKIYFVIKCDLSQSLK